MKPFALGLIALVVALAGCNTIGGAGQDLSAGGRAITDTARDTQREIVE
jgi:predicted small secreted protein